MTERQLSKAVVALAELYGWKVFVIQNTRAASLRSHTGVGWPDLFMVRDRRSLAVELKVKGRKPTEAQVEWLEALERAGVRTEVWNEQSWHDGWVEDVLR